MKEIADATRVRKEHDQTEAYADVNQRGSRLLAGGDLMDWLADYVGRGPLCFGHVATFLNPKMRH